MAVSSPTAVAVPGRAGELLAQLGHRAVVGDLYGTFGAGVYHDVAGHDTHELREIMTLVRRVPGAVLDLAAGSGRITVPLLSLGREVTALELSPHMLALLRARVAELPTAPRQRCTIVAGDMRRFALDRSFAVVTLGTTSISLLDEAGRADLYRSVRSHLQPGGRFLVSTVEVDPDRVDPPELELDILGASGRAYRFFEYVDPAAGHRKVTVFPADLDADQVQVCTTTIRTIAAGALESELCQAGLKVHASHPLPGLAGRLRGVLLEAEPAGSVPTGGGAG